MPKPPTRQTRTLKDQILAAVDAEEELDGDPPVYAVNAMNDDPVAFLRATVRATKRGIRERLDALLSGGAPATEADPIVCEPND